MSATHPKNEKTSVVTSAIDKAVEAATAAIPTSGSDQPVKQSKNASMEAFSSGTQDKEPGEGASAEELRKAAIEEANRYQIAREAHEDNADRASWTLIRLMLRIAESFERPDGSYDEPAFQQFLTNNGAPPRDNAASDSHRLAKACTPRGMKSSRVSKFGGTVHALKARGIKSDTVLGEFEKRLPVKDEGPSHFGVNRFYLLYQMDKREEAERENAGKESANPYAAWPRSKLLKQGKLLLEVLWKEGLIPAEFEGVEAALDAALLAE